MPIDQVKTILQIFSALFFGFLFFAGFGLTIMNGYRASKNSGLKKVRNIVGLLFGIGLVIGAIAVGSNVLQMINAISGEQQVQTDNVVLSYINTSD